MDRTVSKYRRYFIVLAMLIAASLVSRFAVTARRPVAAVPAASPLPSDAASIPTTSVAVPSEPVAAESAAPFPESAQQICGCASPPTVLTNENGPDANAVDFHSEATNATDPGVELAGQISPGAMRFENEIRPIFVDHCYRCMVRTVRRPGFVLIAERASSWLLLQGSYRWCQAIQMPVQ